MRRWMPILLIVIALPLVYRACRPASDAGSSDASGTAIDMAAIQPETGHIDAAAEAAARDAAAAGQAARHAAATVHAYLRALPGRDQTRADAYWSAGTPGDPPEDALLRGYLPGLQDMRVENDAPRPLDRQRPPRAYEIPVRLRLRHADGELRLQGHYRLRARIDGDGWEITSAALQPVLD